jgi:hypothetical protein
MDLGVPLKVTGTVSVVGDNCTFSSSSGTENVVDLSAISVFSQTWNWRRCQFSQNTNTSSRMMPLAGLGANSQVVWDTCVFVCSRLNSYMMRAQNMQFDNCLFFINNPPVLGVPRLGGVVDAQTEPLFQFLEGCSVRDCIIDANNSEVNNNAGRPDIDAALFCSVQKANVTNLKIVNINRQVYSVQEYSSLVDLREGAILNGLTTEFTATASVQGGLQKLDAAVTFNVGHIHFSDYTIEAAANWPGTAIVRYPCAVGAESGTIVPDVRVDRVRILDYFAGICHVDNAASRKLAHSTFNDCVFGVEGVSGGVDAIGTPLPAGYDITFSRCYFVHIGGPGAGLFTITAGVGPDYKLDHCYASANAAEDVAVGIFHGVGGGAAMNYFNFTGNTFRTTDTAAGVKPFYTGVGSPESATTNVGAANVHTYGAGTTTPPAFAANINAW